MKKIRLIFRRATKLVPEKASKKDLECKKKNKRDISTYYKVTS